MSSYVLDSSAVLAVVQLEPGAGMVEAAMAEGAILTTVNLSEVVARLTESGLSEQDIRRALARLEFAIVEFDAELAFQAGLLRPLTRHAGLSLGDRACLALARQLQLPVLTADRAC